jgi:hypothetical protein
MNIWNPLDWGRTLAAVHQEVMAMRAEFQAAMETLRTEIAEVKTVQASAVSLIGGLVAKLEEAVAADDIEAVAALTAELKVSTDPLAAAVAANTAAAPAPVDAPTE